MGAGNGWVARETGAAILAYDAAVFAVAVERVGINDARLGGVWGDHLTRVVFTAEAPPQSGTWAWTVTR